MNKIISFLTVLVILALMVLQSAFSYSYAQTDEQLIDPLLIKTQTTINRQNVYNDIKFTDPSENEIPVLINVISDKEAVVIPLYDMTGTKSTIKTTYKDYAVSKYTAQTFVGDEANLKKLTELTSGRGRMMNTADMPMMEKSVEDSAAPAPAASGAADGGGFSSTNVQVEGIDEADTVKTDGQHIYYLRNNEIVIVKADKGSMGVVSEIGYLESALYPTELYIQDNMLIVMGSSYNNRGSFTKAIIYDVTDKASPKVKRIIEQEGYYITSRKKGNELHILSSHNLYANEGGTVLPAYRDTADSDVYKSISPSDIMIYPRYPSASVVIAASVDISKDEPLNISSFIGNAENTYMSMDSLYLTYQEMPYYMPMPMPRPMIEPAPESTTEDNIAPPRESMSILPAPQTLTTTIKKFDVNETKITYRAQNKINGYVLNQFSMGEHDGYFRVAYTTDHWDFKDGSSVTVFDKDMKKTGSLDNIAPGERIYSARFIGDRAYMVTFKTTDPFFVIDLKTPSTPKMLGYLKIPGYSDYLHPYDENHIIGFGKDAVEVNEVAYYLGMKIALFDVTDVANPVQKDMEQIGDRGTESEVLHNHKALMYDKSRGIMGFPISVAKVDPSVKPNIYGFPPYGEQVFQGAYIYQVSADKGIDLKGTITQMNDFNPYLYSYDNSINRVIYIDDTIYTLSNNAIMATDLNTMNNLSTVKIN